jgi:hypothetical protein
MCARARVCVCVCERECVCVSRVVFALTTTRCSHRIRARRCCTTVFSPIILKSSCQSCTPQRSATVASSTRTLRAVLVVCLSHQITWGRSQRCVPHKHTHNQAHKQSTEKMPVVTTLMKSAGDLQHIEVATCAHMHTINPFNRACLTSSCAPIRSFCILPPTAL